MSTSASDLASTESVAIEHVPGDVVASPSKNLLLTCLNSLPELSRVESLIRTKLACDAPRLEEISSYLLDLGGKRVRPALCLMISKALGIDRPQIELLQVAAGIELIHMATLLHDDIIDKAEVRRHSPSPFNKYGLGDTLLTGDFLLVRAFSLCARLDHYIIDVTEKACVELTEGEILETPLSQERHTVESSLTIARKKTASLFRLACETSAFLAAAPEPVIKHLARFGESVGMAFQVLDDILDVISPQDLMGKAAGTDLREQKPSIVNVLWLQSGDRAAELLTIESSKVTPEAVSHALQILKSSPVVDQARKYARDFVATALSELDACKQFGVNLEPGFEAALKALANYCLERME